MTAKHQPADTANRLTRTALLATDYIHDDERVRQLPIAIRDGLVVKAAIGYLVEHDLITETEANRNGGWLPIGLPEWIENDIADAYARMNGLRP